jgi:hypothetical protein
LPFTDEDTEESYRDPNIAAKSIEGVGFAIRQGLQSGGKIVGDTIRVLGKKYTEYKASESDSHEPRELLADEEEKALARQEAARKFKDAAKVVSSAVMFPIRWTGQKAALLAEDDSNLKPSATRQFAMDTVGGVGNAVAAVAKGFYDAAVSY